MDETSNQPTIKCLSFHQIDELMQIKNPNVFLPFINERDHMGKIIQKHDYDSILNEISKLDPTEEVTKNRRKLFKMIKRDNDIKLNERINSKSRAFSLHAPSHCNKDSFYMNNKNLLSDLLKSDVSQKIKINNILKNPKETKKLYNVENYFKLRENIVNKQKMEILERKKEIVIIPKRETTPAPHRFYDIENSMVKVRGRTPECIIFKENKFNSHNGFYDFLTKNAKINNDSNDSLPISENKMFGNEQFMHPDTKKHEEENLLKDLRVFINRKQMQSRVKNTMDELFKFSLKPLANNFHLGFNERFNQVKLLAQDFHIKYVMKMRKLKRY